MTGDRGLCGEYNSFMIKKSEARYNEVVARGIDVDLFLLEKRESATLNVVSFPSVPNSNADKSPLPKRPLQSVRKSLTPTFPEKLIP